MLRIFRKKSTPVEAPVCKTLYCIPRNILDHALFEEGAPLADIPSREKYALAEAVEARLEAIGWATPFTKGALHWREHTYHWKLREMESRGSVFLDHIKTLIDRAYDYHKARGGLGRAVPQPWPVDVVSVGGCPKHCDEIERLGLDEEWTEAVRQVVKVARTCMAEKVPEGTE